MAQLDQTALTALLGMQEAHSTKQWDKVLTLGEAWVEARGELPAPAAVLYSEALMVKGRIEDALAWSVKANGALDASHGTLKVAAMTTVARALSRAGDFEGSRRLLVECLKIPAPDAETQEKQGHIHLAVKKTWRKGWAMQEARLEEPDRALPPTFKWWDGTTKEPVAVLHEQGIGDAILVSRWLPKLAEYTGHPVTWYGPTLVAPWIAELPDVVVGDITAKIETGVESSAIRAMSLPYYLRCDSPEDVPPPVAPEFLVAKAKLTATDRDTIRVGVCWKGSGSGWHDFERSYTYADFSTIVAPLDGVEFVNLCHDADVPAEAPFERITFSDVMDSAHAIASCHLVVSVDTAVVHLSGALRVPTLALVPTVSDWRYAWPQGTTTPFYPTVTVMRRPTAYSLEAITQARDVVERFVSAARTVETVC